MAILGYFVGEHDMYSVENNTFICSVLNVV